MNYVPVFFLLIFIGFLQTQSQAVRINPCPTNKVARNGPRGRTFGHFVQLFADDDQGGSPLQERPGQTNCDDVGDYDDTDFSSLNNQNEQRPDGENRLFFQLFNGNQFWKPPNAQPQPPRPEIPVTPQRPEIPERPQAPYRPTTVRPQKRPPPGGYLNGNQYSPPYDENPSEFVKPVHESNFEIPAPYRPTVVGGPLNQIVGVGVTSLRPPRPTTERPPCYYYTPRPTVRPSRSGRLSNSVIGSFIDLFLDK